jgi:hypothetical protein
MWATQTSDLGPTGKSHQNKQDLGEQILRAAAALRKLAKGSTSCSRLTSSSSSRNERKCLSGVRSESRKMSLLVCSNSEMLLALTNKVCILK